MRWNGHLTSLLAKKHHNPGLQAVFTKPEDLSFQIMEICTKKQLGKKEKQAIVDAAAKYGQKLTNVKNNPLAKLFAGPIGEKNVPVKP